MKISIIIPVYNVSSYIEECITSVLNQTYDDLEIIIVDDASPDDSMQKVEQLLSDSNRIVKIISLAVNSGQSAARNRGIREASGDYIYFLDSDDILPNKSMAILAQKAIKYNNPDMIVSNYSLLGSNDRIKYPPLKLKDEVLLKDNAIVESLFKKEWQSMTCNKLVKSSLFTEKNCWLHEGIFHEDELWSFQLALNAEELLSCDELTYIYRIREGSTTTKKSVKNFDSLEVVFSEMVKLIKEKQLPMSSLLFTYLMNEQIYFFKELVRNNFSKDEIAKRIERVNSIFKDYNKFRLDFSWRSNLQLLAYKIPFPLAYQYIKAIV